MNWKFSSMMVAFSVFLTCCTTTVSVPYHLASARVAYLNASMGRTSRLAPVDFRVAEGVLAKAEAAFQKNSKSYHTMDLAYVALRKFQLANVMASIAYERESQVRSSNELANILNNKLPNRKKVAVVWESSNPADKGIFQNIDDASLLAVSPGFGDNKSVSRTIAPAKLTQGANDKRASDAVVAEVALAPNVVVTYDSRGMIIMFYGDVLFTPNQSQMRPEARKQLKSVADLLLATPLRRIQVKGYTDFPGAKGGSSDLSQRRADAVRDYLIEKKCDRNLIVATGIQNIHPNDNRDTSQGRNKNRRVEIIVERGQPEDVDSLPAPE
ncbi:MAG: DUF4398 and OmpA-like domain-containing protein [Deltaproteobacteria bacterium]|nr:DUF4398 and OmpA-like domain-containing protein [Deltaproteobacteria bacterium]